MLHSIRALVALAVIAHCVLWTDPMQAQEPSDAPDDVFQIDWQVGPGTADLGSHAEIMLPDGYRFAGPRDTRALLEAMENPTSGSELGLITPPVASGMDWFVVFEFDPIGYVKDDEKDRLDAEDMLRSLREGNAQANDIRRERGWTPVDIIGWEEPPNYDPQTNNLVWGVRLSSDGVENVNYNTRLLGRRGVMVVGLVLGADELSSVAPVFQELLGGFAFKPGAKYSEFRTGDKIAKYGLTALVAGGAGAVAAKTGLLKSLWKLIVLGAMAVVAFFRKIARAIFGSNSTDDESGGTATV